MTLTQKAVLFNALFFPGWGQIYLKHYRKGILIIVGVTVDILSILWYFTWQTIAILKITPIDRNSVFLNTIAELFFKVIHFANFYYLLSMGLLLIALWLFSIFDAYISGKKLGNATTAADQ
jgi:TM2 domain-containing membrane protein YozV